MMDKTLLTYYNHELAFIRKLGEEFSNAHPKVAGRLRLGAGNVEDPHVSRLIESVALLNAHIKHKLDDEFPQIANALLDVLYPHYQSPIPSMAIAQFCHKPSMLKSAYTLKKGTPIKTPALKGTSCLFQTGSDTTLWPIDIVDIAIEQRPFSTSHVLNEPDVQSVLTLHLKSQQQAVSINALEIDALRFFINEQPLHAHELYQAIFSQLRKIVITPLDEKKQPVYINTDQLNAVGFTDQEGLLPYPEHAFLGYRLLTEYFTFPEKFLFFELSALKNALANIDCEAMTIHFYFKNDNKNLAKIISRQSLLLGCVPIINLFKKKATPLKLNHTQSEYLLKPDVGSSTEELDIYAIEEVACSMKNAASITIEPFYGAKKHLQAMELFWHAHRKPSWESFVYAEDKHDVYVSFVDLECKKDTDAERIIYMDLLCTHHNLPSQYPFKKDVPFFSFCEKATDVIDAIKCIIPMSKARAPIMHSSSSWRLISHLSLNFLSIVNSDASTLKEMLQLYNVDHSEKITTMIDGIVSLNTRRISSRHPHVSGNAFWQGTEITLTLDEKKFSDNGLFLFASILERFFALYCSINSFTQLILSTQQRNEIYRWSPRTGEKTLL